MYDEILDCYSRVGLAGVRWFEQKQVSDENKRLKLKNRNQRKELHRLLDKQIELRAENRRSKHRIKMLRAEVKTLRRRLERKSN